MGPCTVPSAQTCPTPTPAPWRNRRTPRRRSDILSAPPMLAWPCKRQKTIDRLWSWGPKMTPPDRRCHGFSMVPGTILLPYTHIVSGRNGDRTSLLARLRTTPWSRKKQHMVRAGQSTARVFGSDGYGTNFGWTAESRARWQRVRDRLTETCKKFRVSLDGLAPNVGARVGSSHDQ